MEERITVDEILKAIDSLKPNSFTREEKLSWLTTFDGRICRELLDHYEKRAEESGDMAPTYDPEEGSKLLLVPQPYGRELYLCFLENIMDHYNGDTARYNNSVERLAEVYRSFARKYHRTHRPLGQKRKFW